MKLKLISVEEDGKDFTALILKDQKLIEVHYLESGIIVDVKVDFHGEVAGARIQNMNTKAFRLMIENLKRFFHDFSNPCIWNGDLVPARFCVQKKTKEVLVKEGKNESK